VTLSPAWPKRLLYFTHRAAWPLNTGAKLRNYYLAHGLAKHTKVTFLAFEDDSGDYLSSESLDAKAEFAKPLERVVTLVRGKAYTPGRVLRGVFGEHPISVENYTTREMTDTVTRLCDEMNFDAVQVEGVHLAACIPALRAARSKPVLVCDWHNIESEVQRRYGENTKKPHIKLAAYLFAKRLAAYEPRFARKFDAHVTVSERDRQMLQDLVPEAKVYAVDNGVDVGFFDPVRRDNEARPGSAGRLVFVGSMDYHANVDAAREFALGPWPRIRERHPGFTFTVVGRNPSADVLALAKLPGVEVTGSVRDVRPYYVGAVAAVVPLRIGGGSRLKILEAMAAGVPVVSTELGAEGIPTDGEHMLTVPTVDALAEGVLALASDPAKAARMSAAGRALVERRYDWGAIGETLMGVYRALAGKKGL
jgi:sugar transferase (PEP-CTERM/EpsH1 system associated)